jgi:Dyp-type peroxidase family
MAERIPEPNLTFPSALALEQGPAIPGAPEEPILEVQEIQGNILVGFNSDYQHFIFFQITETAVTKRWLHLLIPHVATVDETLSFRRLFRALRSRRALEPAGMMATWVNVAFSFEGIRKLTSAEEANRFASEAFKKGLAERSGILGDPTDPGQEGNPKNWVVGNGENRPDILVIIASDSRVALKNEVKRIKAEIKALQGISPGRRTAAGLRILFEQPGANLTGSLAGHEHFGFKDGVSQPGIRGRIPGGQQNFLTPRLVDPQDSHALKFAKPGQPLIWPGQFVLGYPLQADSNDIQPAPQSSDNPPWPAWARNGSFLVFRRLRQDVHCFWAFAGAQANQLKQVPGFEGMTPERFAALFVGRWPSGAPIMRSQEKDLPDLGRNSVANNNFRFSEDTEPVSLRGDLPYESDDFPPAVGDAKGIRCPFAAHIRKVNPRDDTTDLGGAKRTLLKRILRRGIPYGPQLENPLTAADDKVERGLLFLSYQASIEEQFEFLTQNWANRSDLPQEYDENRKAGHDPVIGQSQSGESRKRFFTLRGSDGSFQNIEVPDDFVIPTGGDYLFSPSMTALKEVLAG